MKAAKDILFSAVACSYVFLCTGCGDLLWHLTQASPALGRLSDRMNDRAYERQIAGEPLRELDQNIARGDYRYRGLYKHNKQGKEFRWVPGIRNGNYSVYEVVWRGTITGAEPYFRAYNLALESRRTGKKLNGSGSQIQERRPQ